MGGVEACGAEDVAELVAGWVEAIVVAATMSFSACGREGGKRDGGEIVGGGGGGSGSSNIAAWRRGRLANAFEIEGSFGLGALAAGATMRGASSRGVCRPMQGGGSGRL